MTGLILECPSLMEISCRRFLTSVLNRFLLTLHLVQMSRYIEISQLAVLLSVILPIDTIPVVSHCLCSNPIVWCPRMARKFVIGGLH